MRCSATMCSRPARATSCSSPATNGTPSGTPAESIAPAGFERFFAALVDLGGVAQADPAVLGGLCEQYALELDPSSVAGLVERFGVRFPAEPLSR